MHYVSHIDWSFADRPGPPSPTALGLARLRLIGPDQGAVHTEIAVGAIHPGGWIAPHVHSFEEVLYVLQGEVLLDLGGAVHRLRAADYALIPTGLNVYALICSVVSGRLPIRCRCWNASTEITGSSPNPRTRKMCAP